MLTLTDLEAGYGRVPVLHRVSLTAAPDRITLILGRNGAGKSTLLKAILGLCPTTQGRIHFQNRDLRPLSTEARARLGLAYVPEGRELFPKLTVAETLIVGTFARTQPGPITQDLEQVFALFPRLAERRNQLAGTLSGGEQHMLAMARALMNRPQLMLLDEPSFGLAPRLVAEVFQFIKQLPSLGVGVLWVEQNAVQSLALADQAYLLEDGRVVVAGSAAAVRDDPRLQKAYLTTLSRPASTP